MSAEVSRQLTNNPRVLYVAAGIIGVMGVVPNAKFGVFIDRYTSGGNRFSARPGS